MKARESGCTQETAAAKGGFSVRTGRRIEKGEHQPQRGRPHDWRTRKDPLAEVWDSELVPLLQKQPQLQAMTLFEYLQQKHPGKYGQSILRTLQRRVQQWRATSEPAQEVMFELAHQPGKLCLSEGVSQVIMKCQRAQSQLHCLVQKWQSGLKSLVLSKLQRF